MPTMGLLTASLLLDSVQLHAQDTLVVRADNAPVWGDSPRLVEELRIGTLDGDDAYTFGRVAGVAVGDDGVIWVGDDLDASVCRFAPDGLLIDRVGRRGEGPGEFKGISGLKRLPNGQVVVWDASGGRISVFDRGGGFVRSMPRYVGVSKGVPEVFQVDTSGAFFLLVFRLGPEPTPQRFRAFWLKIAPNGEIADSIDVPPTGLRVLGSRALAFGPMAPYVSQLLSVVSPAGYVAVANTGQYSILRPLKDGRILRIDRSWEPVALARKERAQAKLRAQVFAERWDAAYGFHSDIPQMKPPVWAFRVDEEGRYWLARHVDAVHVPETVTERSSRTLLDMPPDEWREPLVVDVIEPGGRFLGTLRFRERTANLGAARGERVWMVELGEFDEQYVVQYRIER